MSTDDERRDVARRIREKGSISYYSDVYKLVMGKKAPLETSAREDDEALAERLADLIEPEPERITRRACHIEKYPPKSEIYFETCSECGCILSATWPGDRHCKTANYCPNCGAKVVES